MATQSFFCPNCDKITLHDSITAGEFMSLSGYNSIVSGFARFGDAIGTRKLYEVGLGWGWWKCRNCATGFIRKQSGEIISSSKD